MIYVMQSPSTPQCIEQHTSTFQNIEIFKHPSYGHQLVIDGDLQISSSDLAYQVSMTAPLIGKIPAQSNVAILGGGDGGVLNQLLDHHDLGHINLAKAVMIDIDEMVISLCKKHLPTLNQKISNHPQAEVVVGDAFAYLAAQENSLDAIIYDLTMTPINASQSQEAFTRETLTQIAKALKPSGVLTMQVCGLQEHEPHLVEQANFLQEFVPALCKDIFEQTDTQQVFIPSFEMPWLFQYARQPRTR